MVMAEKVAVSSAESLVQPFVLSHLQAKVAAALDYCIFAVLFVALYD